MSSESWGEMCGNGFQRANRTRCNTELNCIYLYEHNKLSSCNWDKQLEQALILADWVKIDYT